MNLHSQTSTNKTTLCIVIEDILYEKFLHQANKHKFISRKVSCNGEGCSIKQNFSRSLKWKRKKIITYYGKCVIRESLQKRLKYVYDMYWKINDQTTQRILIWLSSFNPQSSSSHQFQLPVLSIHSSPTLLPL